ncbi:MAG: SMI1/KNR4 family protein [Myxococcota bacterium]
MAPASPAESWSRLEQWFSKHQPALTLKLRPPASEQQIAAAELALGVDFPTDFRASLLVHDGQENEPDVCLFPYAQRLGSLESLVQCWKDDRSQYDEAEMRERLDWLSDDERVRQVHFHPKHVPIAGSPFWDYGRLLLDFIPGPRGSSGQIIARDDIHFVYVCESFGGLLAKTAQGLEDGTIAVVSGPYQRELQYLSRRGKKAVPAFKYFA